MNIQLKSFWFILMIVLYSAKDVSTCEISDVECVTRATRFIYNAVMPGIEGIGNPSDPMFQKEIIAEVPTYKCKLLNVTMSGMSKCYVTQFMYDNSEEIYDFFLRCPHIVYNAYFIAKGRIENIDIDAKGDLKVDLDDHEIHFKGSYKKVISEKDKKLHLDQITHEIHNEEVEGIKFEFINMATGDKATYDEITKFMNQNWRMMLGLFRVPIIDSFLDMFAENIITYLKTIPIEDLLLQGDNASK